MNITTIANFRKVFKGTQSVCGVYRSAMPDTISSEEMKTFKQLGIRSIIDLRNFMEYKRTTGNKLIDKTAHLISINPTTSEFIEQDQSEMTNKCEGHIKHYFLNIPSYQFKMAIARRFPWYIRFLFALMLIVDQIFGTRFSNMRIIQYYCNNSSLYQLYVDHLEYSQNILKTVLKLLSSRDSVPALICCAAGKDRTGMVCAVIQGCLGLSNEEIIENYHQSEKEMKELDEDKKHIIFRKNRIAKHLWYAKKQTMRKFLEYIEEMYGSIPEYLESIGFGREDQQALRKNLIR